MKKIAYIFIFITILSIVIATSHSKISFAGNEVINSVQTTTDKWSFSAHPFTGEGYESRPVMVTSVKTEIKTLTVTAVRVRNISSKSVTALKLGWYLINDKDKNTILQQGETQLIPIEKSLLSGKGELLSLPIASFTELQKPLVEKGKLEGAYKLIVSVSEIYFEDKTNWKPGQKIEIAKQSTEVKLVKTNFSENVLPLTVTPLAKAASCAKQNCQLDQGPPPGYRCASSSNDEYCTNCQTFCCNTLCNESSPACGPC